MTGQMFRARDVVFEEGVAHRTLPDSRNGPPADLFEILDIADNASNDTDASGRQDHAAT